MWGSGLWQVVWEREWGNKKVWVVASCRECGGGYYYYYYFGDLHSGCPNLSLSPTQIKFELK